MSGLVKEWIEKAEGDYHSALREYRARNHPNYDAAGFHAQQCAEKYLKALLQRESIRIDKIHDLLALLQLCLPAAPNLELYKELLAALNPFVVAYRYPGESATRDQAYEAIQSIKKLRAIFTEILNVD
jgi:HEPN domain-containing protein